MSDKKCCVPRCTYPEGTAVGSAVLHRFPNPETDRERFNTWLMAIGGDVVGLQNNHIYKYRRVCHSHFEAKYHCRNHRISNVAVPTLNLPGPLSLPQFSLIERRPLRNIQIIGPSSSKEVAQHQFLFGECTSLQEQETKESFLLKGPETHSTKQEVSSALPIIVEQMEIVPSSSVSRHIEKPASENHGPETHSTKQEVSSALPIIVEQMEIVPSSSVSQHIEKPASENHGPETQSTKREVSSALPVIVEQMEIVPSSFVSQHIEKPASENHGPETHSTKQEVSSALPIIVEQMEIVPSSSVSRHIEKPASENHGPETHSTKQEVSSALPIIVEQMEIVPSSSVSRHIEKPASENHGPETHSTKQEVSSALPIIVEQMEIVPSSSVSRHIEKPASENHGPETQSTKREVSSALPVIVEQMEIVPSSSVSQHIEKPASENHGPEKPETQGEEMQSSGTVHSQKSKKSVRSKRGKRSLKKCVLPLTSNEKALKMKIVSLQIKVSKLKNKAKKQMAELKAVKNLSTNPDVLKVLESCSSTAKLFFELQWRESKKKQKGRRFTLKEKIVALSILKQSPKAYRFFRKIFLLPAPQTLTKLVQKANIEAGINKNIFQQLKSKAEAMKEQEKLCVLLFDEVSLMPNISYSDRKDRVTGFVNNGDETKPEFANHAQVFMVRGLIKNYKQPVSYTFSASATKGPELAKQIKSVITEVQKAGLIVVATICDQGSNNRQAVKLLVSEARGICLRRGESPKNSSFLVNDQEIVALFDPPHLLKCIRNNLLTKDLQYIKDGQTRVAKWSHLRQLYEESPGYKGIRLIPKLSGNHVYPEKINKMKVKYATQIFSQTVASNMGYLADKGVLPRECKDTADLLLIVDKLFDSVNGSATKNRHAKPLLGPATQNSVHEKTWNELIKVLSNMKFVTDSKKKEPAVFTIQNWVWTLKGIKDLLKNLRVKFGVTSVWLRHLNQDPLENFFGAIRSHGCRNINPTCDQFQSAYVALIINNLSSVHTHGNNCEEDFTESLHALIIDDSNAETPSCNIEVGNIMNINFTPMTEKEVVPSIIGPLQYVSGYILKKTKTNIFQSCEVCKDNLTTTDEVEYIRYREYAGQRWLCSPSYDLLIFISQLQDITNHILKEQLETNNLKETIKTAMYTLMDFQ